jgi:serine/threonine-protein kinase
MGVIYAATDERSREQVALKLLERENATPMLERRFRREFHTLAGLAHPRIVRVHDYGVDARGPYYTMDLLDGHDLDRIAKLDVAPACRILRDVASALAFLHARRLLHRDVKLKNVRLTTSGDAKLMDFGLLATSGIAPDDVVGTPTYMAPECLRMAVLDHRVDLFALGSVAYRLLTGHAPFRATKFEELEELWRASPRPPSELAPGIPAPLDALVLSLLCVNPLGRPSSAAEVIDRVTTIGGLDRAPELETARGYLASAAIVGRDAEMARLQATMTSALDHRAASATIEAASGEGKSRLLRELAIEAQLAGATTIAVDCGAEGHAPFGVLRKVVESLLATSRSRTLRAAAPRIGVIGRALPEVRARLGVAVGDEPLGDPAEERLRLQSELAAFVLEAIATRRVAIFLDDAQRCDEGSAVAIATARARATTEGLFLGCAVRTDEPARAPFALDTIREGAERVTLLGLTEEATLGLVEASFGDVPNAARFARSLHAASGGSPIQLTELLRDLVESNVVRYEGGLWHLPAELALSLPRGLAEAMDARVAALASDARSLACALAVHGGRLSIETVATIAGTTEDLAIDLTQALITAGFLAFADDRYKIRHDGFREALVRAMAPDEKKRVNLRVGRTLQATAGDAAAAQVGRYLMAGGEELEGARLLERGGHLAFDTQSFEDAIEMLEAALDVYEARGLVPKRCLELRVQLVACGMQCSKAAVERHAQKVIDLLERTAGIPSMRTLGTRLPFAFAFLLAMAWAWLRWIGGGMRRTPNPIAALTAYFTAVTYLGTVCAISADLDGALAAGKRLEVFAPMTGRMPHAAYLLARSFYTCQTGAWVPARADLRVVLDIFAKDKLTPIREIDLRMGEGGARFAIASLFAQDQQPESLVWLDSLDVLGLRFFGAGSKAARVLYHRLRGEERLASTIEREMELEFLQGASLWILEAQLQWQSALSYVYIHDVVGMRRSIERLETLCARGFRYQPMLDLLRAEHLRISGEGAGGRHLLERCLAGLPAEELRVREQALLALAETALAESDWSGAERWSKECLALAERPECGRATPRLLAVRVRALASAGRGELAEATALLDGIAAEVEALGSPMMHVEVLLARARIARWAGDPAGHDAYVAEAKTWAERAENTALVARIELLVPGSSARLLGRVAGPESDLDTVADPSSDEQTTALDRPAHPRASEGTE